MKKFEGLQNLPASDLEKSGIDLQPSLNGVAPIEIIRALASASQSSELLIQRAWGIRTITLNNVLTLSEAALTELVTSVEDAQR